MQYRLGAALLIGGMVIALGIKLYLNTGSCSCAPPSYDYLNNVSLAKSSEGDSEKSVLVASDQKESKD